MRISNSFTHVCSHHPCMQEWLSELMVPAPAPVPAAHVSTQLSDGWDLVSWVQGAGVHHVVARTIQHELSASGSADVLQQLQSIADRAAPGLTPQAPLLACVHSSLTIGCVLCTVQVQHSRASSAHQRNVCSTSSPTSCGQRWRRSRLLVRPPPPACRANLRAPSNCLTAGSTSSLEGSRASLAHQTRSSSSAWRRTTCTAPTRTSSPRTTTGSRQRARPNGSLSSIRTRRLPRLGTWRGRWSRAGSSTTRCGAVVGRPRTWNASPPRRTRPSSRRSSRRS